MIGTPGYIPTEQALGRPVFASDIYCLGLTAIFMLTGKRPQELSDLRTGDIAWQRYAKDLSSTLSEILEKAIRSEFRERFPEATDMLLALNVPNSNLLLGDDSSIIPSPALAPPLSSEVGDANMPKVESDLEAILSAVSSEANTKLAKNKLLYDQAMNQIKGVRNQLAKKVAPTYQTFQSGYVNFAEGLRNTLGFSHFATQDRRFAPTFLIRIVGEEIVVEADDRTIYRTSVDAPIFGEEFTAIIYNIFVKGLRELVDLPPL